MFAPDRATAVEARLAEDAPALTQVIADETIVRNLSSAPWPFSLRDAEAHLAAPRDPLPPTMLVFERTDGAPVLVGSCGLGRRASGSVEFGYWIARAHWGRGFATEAGQALIGIARSHGLRRPRGVALSTTRPPGVCSRSLGFQSTGIIAPRLQLRPRRKSGALFHGCSLQPMPTKTRCWPPRPRRA
jgi:hypothetical protein